jgi:lipopolysaccharide/colanic/teichoic acid biosynthesis glycosyltransferase
MQSIAADSEATLILDPMSGLLIPHISVFSFSKRLIDIIGSLIGLCFLGIIFIPIAIAIKLDSPGEIFYSQERYGLMGKPFRIYKFRSMVTNADKLKSSVDNEAKGLIFKNSNDPRVTRVGRFLRKTSLDEFPQFWNVLKGEMSLVGTRPPTPDEITAYRDHHWQRLSVKPGITGEWQVSGRSLIKDFEDVVQLDLRYQDRWHPLYDLILICKTILVLVTKHGAY